MFLCNGIGGVDKEGRPYPITLAAVLEWRDAAIGGAWTQQSWALEGSNPNQLGYTEVVTLPYMMRPQVRMRRLTSVSNDGKTRDTINWYGLRTKLDAPTSYSDVSILTMSIRGGDRLSQQSENRVSL